MIAQLILLINLQHVRNHREPPLPTMLTMGDWLGTLISQPGPVLVGTATIPALGHHQATLGGAGGSAPITVQ